MADVKEWIEWAIKRGIDPRIIAYIMIRPQRLFEFKTGQPFPSPRSWFFVDRYLKIERDYGLTIEQLKKLIAGCVGPETALDFIAFLELKDAIANLVFEGVREGELPKELLYYEGRELSPEEIFKSLQEAILFGRKDLVMKFLEYLVKRGGAKVRERSFSPFAVFYYLIITTVEHIPDQIKFFMKEYGLTKSDAKIKTKYEIQKLYNELISVTEKDKNKKEVAQFREWLAVFKELSDTIIEKI